MPFCPSCGKEYAESMQQCPDCDEDLVDQFTEEHFAGEITEVFRTFSPAEAGMVKELLLDEGIFAAVSNEMASSILGSTISDMGEARVFTSERDAARAKELIETYIEDNPLEQADEYLICDHCGAKIEESERFCPFCGEPFDE